jgi:integrase
LAAANSKLPNGRTKSLIFKMQYSTAGRIGEITKLRLGDLTFPEKDGDLIKIRLISKTKMERTCFYPGNLANDIKEHIKCNNITRTDDFIFPSVRNPAIHVSTGRVIADFSTLLSALPGNWKRCSTHLLRRSPAQSMVDSGADIGKVSRYLSHSDLQMTTDHYARFRRAKLHADVRKALPEFYCTTLSNAIANHA